MRHYHQRQVYRQQEVRLPMWVKLNDIEETEVELEEWLVEQAGNGVPEIVLVGVLRDYADDIEQLGYVPRMWGHTDH